jgi:hypothetical protein
MIYGLHSTEELLLTFYDGMMSFQLKNCVLGLEKEEFIKQWKANKEEFEKKIHKQTIQSSTEVGILCLSETNDNIKMWGHYANSHRGVCLEFDIRPKMLPDDFEDPTAWKINYPENNLYQSFLEEESTPQESLLVGMLTKAKIWSEEREFRLFARRAGLKKINKKCLRKIIFGVYTPDEERETLIKLVSKLDYPDLSFAKCILSETEYKVIVEDISE